MLELAEQGFMTREYRTYRDARLGPYFKLRWRSGGRQRVKYLGRDVPRAEAVAAALADLRVAKRRRQQLAALIAGGRKSLRRVKQALEPALANQGRSFHGYECRKARSTSAQPEE